MKRIRQILFHQLLFRHPKSVLCLLAILLIFTVLAYCNQEWAISRHIICYFKFWQQPFVALSTAFIAYTAWVALGYVIQQQHESRKNKG